MVCDHWTHTIRGYAAVQRLKRLLSGSATGLYPEEVGALRNGV